MVGKTMDNRATQKLSSRFRKAEHSSNSRIFRLQRPGFNLSQISIFIHSRREDGCLSSISQKSIDKTLELWSKFVLGVELIQVDQVLLTNSLREALTNNGKYKKNTKKIGISHFQIIIKLALISYTKIIQSALSVN